MNEEEDNDWVTTYEEDLGQSYIDWVSVSCFGWGRGSPVFSVFVFVFRFDSPHHVAFLVVCLGIYSQTCHLA